MDNLNSEKQDLERHSKALADQAERLINIGSVSVFGNGIYFPQRSAIFSRPICFNRLALLDRPSMCPLNTTEVVFLLSTLAISALLCDGYIVFSVAISFLVQRGLFNFLFTFPPLTVVSGFHLLWLKEA
jgi:hypothetical protein